MKAILLVLMLFCLVACEKDKKSTVKEGCNMVEVLQQNSRKVTIGSGIWGTTSLRTGDCMPTTGSSSTCSQCPVKREVRIYAYTTLPDAVQTPGTIAYDSFKTQLIKTVTSDEQGFFEAELPNGKYTVVLVENGKLYANSFDGNGGISSGNVQQSKVNVDVVLNRAVD
jgi:hypothetical protein